MSSAATAPEPVVVTSRSALRELVESAVETVVLRAEERVEEARRDGRLGWISNSEAMTLLGKSKATLARWREDGLPYSKIGTSVYYSLDDLNDWLRQHAA